MFVMKRIFLLFLLMISVSIFAQKKISNQTVEASCGMCQFNQKTDKGCALTVRIDKKIYDVVGTGLNDHGDAHADDGFCTAIRKAKVSGEIKGKTFVASSFTLLPKE